MVPEMTLRKKVLLTSIGIISLFFLLNVLIVGKIVTKIHTTYEHDQVTNQIQQTKNIFESEIKGLDQLNFDYAAWDDTLSFVTNKNEDYINSNLTKETLIQNNIDLMLFFDENSELIYGCMIDSDGNLIKSLPPFHWLETNQLSSLLTPNQKVNGMVQSNEEILLLSARPILTSQYEGPSRGTLLFGRVLDDELINRIGDKIGFDLKIIPILPNMKGSVVSSSNQEDLYIQVINDKTISGFSSLVNLAGETIGYIEVMSERTIYNNAQKFIRINLFSLLILLVIVSAVLFFTFDRIFVSRIIKLKQSVDNIRTTNDLSHRVGVDSRDEIGELALQMNEMLHVLEAYNNKWKQQANYDSLTKLPNRMYITNLLDEMTSKSRDEHSLFAVLFIDLDGFKFVNDTYGHDIGDILLKIVAKRINRITREEDTVSRLSGDEFLIVTGNLTNGSHSIDLAKRVIDTLTEPISIQTFTIVISASIGISHFPNHGTDQPSLIKCADEAMYIAKRSGKNNFHLWTK